MAKKDLTISLVVLGVRLLNPSTMELQLGPSADNPSNSFTMLLSVDQADFYHVGKSVLSTVVK